MEIPSFLIPQGYFRTQTNRINEIYQRKSSTCARAESLITAEWLSNCVVEYSMNIAKICEFRRQLPVLSNSIEAICVQQKLQDCNNELVGDEVPTELDMKSTLSIIRISL